MALPKKTGYPTNRRRSGNKVIGSPVKIGGGGNKLKITDKHRRS